MAYKLGKKIQDEGVWREYKGAELMIGRAGSVEFLKASARLERPHRKRIARGTLDPSTQRRLNIESLAQAILLDWRNVESETGEKLSYDPEQGYIALDQDPDLLDFVIEVSIDNDNFAVEEEDAIAKKSQSTKSG